MEITELVAGSLTDEVQMVALRAEGAVGGGTFRLEVGVAPTDIGERNHLDADHDGVYWTSQLSANSSDVEVRTITLRHTIYCFHVIISIIVFI